MEQKNQSLFYNEFMEKLPFNLSFNDPNSLFYGISFQMLGYDEEHSIGYTTTNGEQFFEFVKSYKNLKKITNLDHIKNWNGHKLTNITFIDTEPDCVELKFVEDIQSDKIFHLTNENIETIFKHWKRKINTKYKKKLFEKEETLYSLWDEIFGECLSFLSEDTYQSTTNTTLINNSKSSCDRCVAKYKNSLDPNESNNANEENIYCVEIKKYRYLNKFQSLIVQQKSFNLETLVSARKAKRGKTDHSATIRYFYCSSFCQIIREIHGQMTNIGIVEDFMERLIVFVDKTNSNIYYAFISNEEIHPIFAYAFLINVQEGLDWERKPLQINNKRKRNCMESDEHFHPNNIDFEKKTNDYENKEVCEEVTKKRIRIENPIEQMIVRSNYEMEGLTKQEVEQVIAQILIRPDTLDSRPAFSCVRPIVCHYSNIPFFAQCDTSKLGYCTKCLQLSHGTICLNCKERLAAKYHRWYPHLIRLEPIVKRSSDQMYRKYKPLFEHYNITWHDDKQLKYVMNNYILLKIYCSHELFEIDALHLERIYMTGVFAGREFNTGELARKLLREGLKLTMFIADFPDTFQFLCNERSVIAEHLNNRYFQGKYRCYFYSHLKNIEGWYDPSTITNEKIVESFKELCNSVSLPLLMMSTQNINNNIPTSTHRLPSNNNNNVITLNQNYIRNNSNNNSNNDSINLNTNRKKNDNINININKNNINTQLFSSDNYLANLFSNSNINHSNQLYDSTVSGNATTTPFSSSESNFNSKRNVDYFNSVVPSVWSNNNNNNGSGMMIHNTFNMNLMNGSYNEINNGIMMHSNLCDSINTFSSGYYANYNGNISNMIFNFYNKNNSNTRNND